MHRISDSEHKKSLPRLGEQRDGDSTTGPDPSLSPATTLLISSGHSLVTLKLDHSIVYLLQQTWSSQQDAKPAGEEGKSHWLPLLSSRLQWLHCYPHLHLAGSKFTRECLHRPQTHPGLKGRHAPSSPQHPSSVLPCSREGRPR